MSHNTQDEAAQISPESLTKVDQALENRFRVILHERDQELALAEEEEDSPVPLAGTPGPRIEGLSPMETFEFQRFTSKPSVPDKPTSTRPKVHIKTTLAPLPPVLDPSSPKPSPPAQPKPKKIPTIQGASHQLINCLKEVSKTTETELFNNLCTEIDRAIKESWIKQFREKQEETNSVLNRMDTEMKTLSRLVEYMGVQQTEATREVSGAAKELKEAVDKTVLPKMKSLMAKSSVPERVWSWASKTGSVTWEYNKERMNANLPKNSANISFLKNLKQLCLDQNILTEEDFKQRCQDFFKE